MNHLALSLVAAFSLFVSVTLADSPPKPCKIQVVDRSNGWPVPMVEFETVHGVRLVTDNTGIVAFDLPELTGVETWLTVRGQGYTVPTDGFGYSGVRITPKPGEVVRIEVDRELPAKRLGRLTGAGLFAESQKLGGWLNHKESGVLGCDSVQEAMLGDRRFLLWGDTNLQRYPLGIFHSTAGTVDHQPLQYFEPPVDLNISLFRDDNGLPRGVAQMPGKGPTWLSGLVTLPDASGRKHLCAMYTKIRGSLTAYESGLCVWDESAQSFTHLKTLWQEADGPADKHLTHLGHATFWTDTSQVDRPQQWLLYGDPFPFLKLPATYEAWTDPSSWESIKSPDAVSVSVDPTKPPRESVKPHRGSIAWNEFRGRWVTVFTSAGGRNSYLGDVWYAEANSPFGPWSNARLIISLDNYTFYNPRLHADWTPPGSPILLFEGTFSKTFSKNTRPTPRYDYNQLLYRLDLGEMDLGD